MFPFVTVSHYHEPIRHNSSGDCEDCVCHSSRLAPKLDKYSNKLTLAKFSKLFYRTVPVGAIETKSLMDSASLHPPPPLASIRGYLLLKHIFIQLDSQAVATCLVPFTVSRYRR